jgi:hypothetical protein
MNNDLNNRGSADATRFLLLPLAYTYCFFLFLDSGESGDWINYILNYDRFSQILLPELDGPTQWYLQSATFHFLYEWVANVTENPFSPLVFFAIANVALLCMLLRKYIDTSSIIFYFLLLNPKFIDLLLIQVRNGLALCIFCIAFLFRSRFLRGALIFLAISIHLSVIYLVASLIIYILYNMQSSVLVQNSNKRFLLALIWLLVFTISLNVSTYLATGLGIRGSADSSSGVGFQLMWILTLFWIVYTCPFFITSMNGFISSSLIIIATTNFNQNIYSDRLVAMSIFFAVIGLANINEKKLLIIAPVLFINLALSVGFRILT